MIKPIKKMLKKYHELRGKAEYVSLDQVTNDLYYLLQEERLSKLRKNER